MISTPSGPMKVLDADTPLFRRSFYAGLARRLARRDGAGEALVSKPEFPKPEFPNQ